MTEIDFQQWQDEVAGSPLKDCMRLCDFLPQDVQEWFLILSDQAAGVLSYTWHSQQNYKKAAQRIKGAVSTTKAGLKTDKFFMKALLDIFDYDRALTAAAVFGVEPLRRRDIPKEVYRKEYVENLHRGTYQDYGGHIDRKYVLLRKKFVWDDKTPETAVDAVVSLMESAEKPNKL